MFTTSSQYKNAIRNSHTAIVRAEVWNGDSKILTLQPLAGSSVDIDSRRSVRRTCSVKLASADPYTILTQSAGAIYADLAGAYATYTDLAAAFANYIAAHFTGDTSLISVDQGIVPNSASDALAPFGNELRLWRGILVTKPIPIYYASLNTGQTYTILDGSVATYAILAQSSASIIGEELIPLGVFRISDVDIDDGNGTTVTVIGSDRSSIISRNKWTQPYTITAGTDLATALSALLQDRWEDIKLRFDATSATINQAVLGTSSQNDPWKDATGIAEALGYELYFASDGVCILTPIRDFANATPDAAYRENSQAMVLKVKRALSNADTFNGVIATGEGTGNAGVYRGEAWDDDPTSPTYISGKFGSVPLFYTSPLITSDSQAGATAAAILNLKKGATESIQWDQIVDPSLDVSDVIALTNAGSKVDRMLVIDRLSIPLDSGSSMSAISRTIRNLNGESFLDLVVA